MHVHRDAAEAFYVLEGEYIIFIDDEETLCPAGSFVYIPAGAVHAVRPRGDQLGGTPMKATSWFGRA